MLEPTLSTLEPFTALALPQLRVVARHSQRLSLPAGRWVLRAGRRLSGHYYLLQGRLQLQPPQASQRVQGPRPEPFYPGSTSARAVTAVELLRVDYEAIAFLLGDTPPRPLQVVPSDQWMERLLQSEVIRGLPPARWQRLLRRLAPRSVMAGTAVLREGDPPDDLYVIGEGKARVHRGTRTLAVLGAGALFGEDAVIARLARNATVSMASDGIVLRLPRTEGLALVREVVRTQGMLAVPSQRQQVLHIGAAKTQAALDNEGAVIVQRLREQIDVLPRQPAYLLTGGTPHMRTLAVFLLLRAGYEAAVLGEDAVTP